MMISRVRTSKQTVIELLYSELDLSDYERGIGNPYQLLDP